MSYADNYWNAGFEEFGWENLFQEFANKVLGYGGDIVQIFHRDDHYSITFVMKDGRHLVASANGTVMVVVPALKDSTVITFEPEKESNEWWSREWYLGIVDVIEYFIRSQFEWMPHIDLRAPLLAKTKTLRKLIEVAPIGALINDESHALFKSTWMDLEDHIAWWKGRVWHEKTMVGNGSNLCLPSNNRRTFTERRTNGRKT